MTQLLKSMFQELIHIAVKIPFTAPLLFMLLFLLTLDVQYIIVFTLIIAHLIFNPILKIIMKSIYQLFKTDTLPILGLGYRPKGKAVCSLFGTSPSEKKTFGMPSGHSEIIWSIIGYYLIYYYNRDKDSKNFLMIYILKALILCMIGLFVSLSRVYIGCHTIRQVLVGGIIGAGSGIGVYYMYPNPPILG